MPTVQSLCFFQSVMITKGCCYFYLQAVWVKKRWEGNFVIVLLAMAACQCFWGGYTDLKSTSTCFCDWLIYVVYLALSLELQYNNLSIPTDFSASLLEKWRQSSHSHLFLQFSQLCHWWKLSGSPKLLLQGFIELKVKTVQSGKLRAEVLWLTDTECDELVKHLGINKLRC